MSFAIDVRNSEVSAIRAAIGDRAAWLWYFFDELAAAQGREFAEAVCRAAVRRFGAWKAGRAREAAGEAGVDPAAWVEQHARKGSAAVFESDWIVEADSATLKFNQCPLLERWVELGVPPADRDLLCDVAMEGDRAKAEALGLKLEIEERLGRGDRCCRLSLEK
ncbi:MAG: hypothetical protein Kow0069_20330 [Promethearchaeota archaeon]